MNERFFIVGVAATSIAIVAIGLRIGAADEIRAAIVIGAPPPREGGRIAWQVRTQDDDGHTRVAAALPISVTLRARGTESVFRAATNVDGVAEIAADVPGLVFGDRVEIDVRDEHGGMLARGVATWPAPAPKPVIIEHAIARPTRSEGALRMHVAVLGGALATGQPGHVWVAVDGGGESPRNPKIEATPDLGLDVGAPWAPPKDPLCARAGSLELIARGHIGGVLLRAKDDLGREGEWYGSIPIGAGAMHVLAPLSAPKGPVTISITSASARSLAYVELDDDAGRVEAIALPLVGEPPHADATFHPPSNGRSFIVVSGEPDGATAIGGATRAIPIWIGPNAPCEADLAEVARSGIPPLRRARRLRREESHPRRAPQARPHDRAGCARARLAARDAPPFTCRARRTPPPTPTSRRDRRRRRRSHTHISQKLPRHRSGAHAQPARLCTAFRTRGVLFTVI